MTRNSRKLFDNAARECQPYSVLVPGASRFRNIVLDKAMRRTLTPILKQFHKLTILEVGCGVGRWTRIMSEKNSVIGIDISRFMIKLAKDFCKSKDCSLVVADAAFLPFRKNVFDLVVSITVLQHMLEAKGFLMALQEISRCTKSKAMIVEEMWSTQEIALKGVYCPIRIVPLGSYVRSMSAAGFRTIQASGTTPATLTILITRLLASKTNTEGESHISFRFRSSKVASILIHTILGLATLSAVFLPSGDYNPRLSLHTILIGEKQAELLESDEVTRI